MLIFVLFLPLQEGGRITVEDGVTDKVVLGGEVMKEVNVMRFVCHGNSDPI